MNYLSDNNAGIKIYKKLKQKKYRYEYGLFVLEGLRSCKDALNGNIDIVCTLCTQAQYEQTTNSGLPNISVVSDKVLSEIADTVHSQGILCICKCIDTTFSVSKAHSLILDNIQDPGNLGTLIRSAVAFGFSDMYLVNCVDLYNEKVIRSSMSGMTKINFHICTKDDILSQKSLVCDHLIAGDMNGKNLHKYKPPQKCRYGLIIGNEGNGISDELLSIADEVLTIPMTQMESLNAGVAGSILMYELSKGD